MVHTQFSTPICVFRLIFLESISPRCCVESLLSRVLLLSSLVLVLMIVMVWLSTSIVAFLRRLVRWWSPPLFCPTFGLRFPPVPAISATFNMLCSIGRHSFRGSFWSLSWLFDTYFVWLSLLCSSCPQWTHQTNHSVYDTMMSIRAIIVGRRMRISKMWLLMSLIPPTHVHLPRPFQWRIYLSSLFPTHLYHSCWALVHPSHCSCFSDCCRSDAAIS